MTLPVPHLEMDITHVCNLHCFGCCHYANYSLKHAVPFATGREWLTAWAARVVPAEFGILGGEPSLHPELCAYLELVSALWPECGRVLVSNGLSLSRHPELFSVLRATGTRLEISLHSHDDRVYQARMARLLPEIREQAVRAGVTLELREEKHLFHVTYRGFGAEMRPFQDRNPQGSWQHCMNRTCTTLYKNRLWKCPPIAYLSLVAERYGLDAVSEWQPYLAYQGVPLQAGDEEIAAVFAEQAASICAMCPASVNPIMLTEVTRQYRPGEPPPYLTPETFRTRTAGR